MSGYLSYLNPYSYKVLGGGKTPAAPAAKPPITQQERAALLRESAFQERIRSEKKILEYSLRDDLRYKQKLADAARIKLEKEAEVAKRRVEIINRAKAEKVLQEYEEMDRISEAIDMRKSAQEASFNERVARRSRLATLEERTSQLKIRANQIIDSSRGDVVMTESKSADILRSANEFDVEAEAKAEIEAIEKEVSDFKRAAFERRVPSQPINKGVRQIAVLSELQSKVMDKELKLAERDSNRFWKEVDRRRDLPRVEAEMRETIQNGKRAKYFKQEPMAGEEFESLMKQEDAFFRERMRIEERKSDAVGEYEADKARRQELIDKQARLEKELAEKQEKLRLQEEQVRQRNYAQAEQAEKERLIKEKSQQEYNESMRESRRKQGEVRERQRKLDNDKLRERWRSSETKQSGFEETKTGRPTGVEETKTGRPTGVEETKTGRPLKPAGEQGWSKNVKIAPEVAETELIDITKTGKNVEALDEAAKALRAAKIAELERVAASTAERTIITTTATEGFSFLASMGGVAFATAVGTIMSVLNGVMLVADSVFLGLWLGDELKRSVVDYTISSALSLSGSISDACKPKTSYLPLEHDPTKEQFYGECFIDTIAFEKEGTNYIFIGTAKVTEVPFSVRGYNNGSGNWERKWNLGCANDFMELSPTKYFAVINNPPNDVMIPYSPEHPGGAIGLIPITTFGRQISFKITVPEDFIVSTSLILSIYAISHTGKRDRVTWDYEKQQWKYCLLLKSALYDVSSIAYNKAHPVEEKTPVDTNAVGDNAGHGGNNSPNTMHMELKDIDTWKDMPVDYTKTFFSDPYLAEVSAAFIWFCYNTLLQTKPKDWPTSMPMTFAQWQEQADGPTDFPITFNFDFIEPLLNYSTLFLRWQGRFHLNGYNTQQQAYWDILWNSVISQNPADSAGVKQWNVINAIKDLILGTGIHPLSFWVGWAGSAFHYPTEDLKKMVPGQRRDAVFFTQTALKQWYKYWQRTEMLPGGPSPMTEPSGMSPLS